MISSSALFNNGHRYNSSHPARNTDDLASSRNLVSPPLAMKARTSGKSSPTDLASKISATYLHSPIRTLCESLNDPDHLTISVHDILEAYNVLSARIRHIMTETRCISGVSYPCFALLAENSADIAQCISRDIQRLLPSPFDTQPLNNSFDSLSYNFDDDMDLEGVQLISDYISLCNLAVRVTSEIFAFPLLYSNFSDGCLVSLLRDALSLCITPPKSSRANLDKPRNFILWILKTQRLSASVLSPLQHDIILALKYGMVSQSATSRTKCDTLKAIYTLCIGHPLLTESLVDVLDTVLFFLTADSMDLRISASFALHGFAIAKLKSENSNSFPRSKATASICTYIKQQNKRLRSQDSKDSNNRLPDILHTAIKEEEHWSGYGPSFSLTVISSFLVLIDRFLWQEPTALRFLVRNIAFFWGHRSSHIRMVHSELWRMLIWAYDRIPTVPVDGDDADADALKTLKESAYRIVAQERRGGLVVDLVANLLALSGGERAYQNVKKSIANISDFVASDDVSWRESGILLLGQVLSEIRPTTYMPVDNHRQPPKFSESLVNGSVAGKTTKNLRVTPFKLDLHKIPPLSEAEVTAHWQDLAESWTEGARRYLDREHNEVLTTSLITAWQTLLLVRSEVAPTTDQHFTASPSLAAFVADTLGNLALPIDAPGAQARCLAFLLRLWGVLKNVFAHEALTVPAQGLYKALLERPFKVKDEHVAGPWAQLCTEVIAVGGVKTLVGDLDAGAANPKQLWRVMAGSECFERAVWREVLRFLVFPIGSWDMSLEEFELWQATLDKALHLARADGDTPQHVVISQLIEMLQDSKLNSLKEDPRTLQCLLSRSHPASASGVDRRLMLLVEECLRGKYFSVMVGEQLDAILGLLRSLGVVLSKTTSAEIVGFLETMRGALACWITDEREILTNDLHDEVVAALYKRPLNLLAGLEPSISMLAQIADFLQTVFLHIRGDGVMAFSAFWRAMYHPRKDIPRDAYPEQIKTCLKAWSVFCDDSLGDDSQSQSQSKAGSSVPDSQLAESLPFGDEVYIQEYESMFAAEVAEILNSRRSTPMPDDSMSRSMSAHASSAKDVDMLAIEGPGRYDASEDESRDARSHASSSRIELGSPSLKRPSGEHHTPPSAKRQRRDVPRISFASMVGRKRGRGLGLSLSHKAAATSMLHGSVSEPVSRTASPLLRGTASQPSSQALMGAERREGMAWLGGNVASGSGRSRLRNTACEGGGDASRDPDPEPEPEMRSSDFDTWEQALSAEDLKEVKSEGEQSDFFSLRSRGDSDTEGASEQGDSDGDILESLSLGAHPTRSRIRYRSQTAPEAHDGSHSLSIGASRPLRREQTSPGPQGHARTLEAPLEALRHAYAALADTSGISQADVEEIIQARRLANQINQVLDEKMYSKVTSSRPE